MTHSSPNRKLPDPDVKPAAQRVTAPTAQESDALTRALRQSFQATVDEDIPDSLMDLISKLK